MGLTRPEHVKQQFVSFSPFSSKSICSFQRHLLLMSSSVNAIRSATNAKLRERYAKPSIQSKPICLSFSIATFPVTDSSSKSTTVYCVVMIRSFAEKETLLRKRFSKHQFLESIWQTSVSQDIKWNLLYP